MQMVTTYTLFLPWYAVHVDDADFQYRSCYSSYVAITTTLIATRFITKS